MLSPRLADLAGIRNCVTTNAPICWPHIDLNQRASSRLILANHHLYSRFMDCLDAVFRDVGAPMSIEQITLDPPRNPPAYGCASPP